MERAKDAVRRKEMEGNSLVLDRPHADAAQRVAQLVCRLFAKRGIERAVGLDDDLTAGGLSSLDLVNLMLSVESEFDIKIPEREMTPANFRSIARIDALLRTLSRPHAR
jgi:acyl carrier protein